MFKLTGNEGFALHPAGRLKPHVVEKSGSNVQVLNIRLDPSGILCMGESNDERQPFYRVPDLTMITAYNNDGIVEYAICREGVHKLPDALIEIQDAVVI